MKAKPNRLRPLRAERRTSQLDLSIASSISASRYWKIENSYVEPTPAERKALARVLKVQESDAFPEAVAQERAS
ncbi:MAG TPA: helix-turn-helix domain-containing protein [Gemmatimonadales bacterium]|nr:helix-turn-helix domain-containing protein [Gemmatimonadales bacterium]